MHWGFRLLRYDLPYILLGAAIGWNSDVCCAVRGRSMLPTLATGDYVMFLPYSLLHVFRRLLQRQLVQEGDVVVMSISPELTVCKRVVRFTVDESVKRRWNDDEFTDVSLEIDGESVKSHNQREKETYTGLETYTRARDWDDCLERVEQPSAWLWLEGDNPQESFDSRSAGAMPLECLRGLVLFKVWPSIGRLPSRPISVV